ncbi:MAG: hypothetical protein JKX74_03400 [Flavobacteriales bacterium]|nr:hypothetical protein [Flavobacteriales bacterium]
MTAKLILITSLLLHTIDLRAQDSSETKCGTIAISKVNRGEVSEIKVLTTSDCLYWPYGYSLATVNGKISLNDYSRMARVSDKRYLTASEFKVTVSGPGVSGTFQSKSQYATPAIKEAVKNIERNGGTASFQYIKTIRDSGKLVTLPSFNFTVNKSN